MTEGRPPTDEPASPAPPASPAAPASPAVPASPAAPASLKSPAAPRPARGRPLVERIGLAGVALVLAALFGGVAVAAWTGGELFLATMGGIGCLMTVWVGAITLLRG